MEKTETSKLDPQFKNSVAKSPGGENLKLCFACGTCTAGCPVAEIDGEFNPRKIIRQIMLGMKQETLSSPLIWRCVQCYACTAKCPQNVRFREIIRALREMAIKEGYADASLASECDEIGVMMQKLRHDLTSVMVSDKPGYNIKKQKIQEILK